MEWQIAPAGFSGATVWRGDDSTRPVIALKAWPPVFSPTRLAQIHGWMRRAAHLPFVPAILETANGQTVVAEAGQTWDAEQWMPGMPQESLTGKEIEAVGAAIAQLHAAWRPERTSAVCRGVSNRLRLLREWHSGQPAIPAPYCFSPELNSLFRRALELVGKLAPTAIRELETWEGQALDMQPCVRDLRLEHVLFEAGQVSGIVDYGAMALDHPAVDLARFLGECSGDPWENCRDGLRAYRSANGQFDMPDEFVMQLAKSGALGSAIIWLRRWLKGSIPAVGIERAECRFEQVIRAIGRFAAY